jgi:hypothetical protein
MSNAPLIEVLGPLGHEDGVAALSAEIADAVAVLDALTVGHEFHRFLLRWKILYPPPLLGQRSAIAAAVKQRR